MLPEDFARLHERIARETEQTVKDAVTFKFTQRVGVDVRQPRWMPTFVWKWMWRRVIVYQNLPEMVEQVWRTGSGTRGW